MLKERTFHIIWVGDEHGVDVSPENNIDEVITYTGEKVIIKKK